jgi:hypothetical protein
LILYVNGDSHSAGAEAVNDFCFANDDPLYYALGRIPHPDNERVSYVAILLTNCMMYFTVMPNQPVVIQELLELLKNI